jgi:antitoxin component of RelBE/YafQ-DinJ toxin-antitoxin module
MLDDDVIDVFRNLAEERGIGYQTAINEALRAAAGSKDVPITVKTLREVLRKELRSR